MTTAQRRVSVTRLVWTAGAAALLSLAAVAGQADPSHRPNQDGSPPGHRLSQGQPRPDPQPRRSPPGPISPGPTTQGPVHLPVNVCGNTAQGNGDLNPAFGNTCVDNR